MKNIVRWCSWVSFLWLLEGLHVHRCSRLFTEGCRGSCHASLNEAVGGFEPRTALFQPIGEAASERYRAGAM